MTIADIFSNVSAIATNVIALVGDWIDAIFDEPILIIAFLLPMMGIGIGLLKRLLNTRM